MGIVVDNSVVIAWCLADELNAYADSAVTHAVTHGAVVPSIWSYECHNSLLVNERRDRIGAEDVDARLADLRTAAFEVDMEADPADVLALARQFNLTFYDAAYLELAFRRRLPLATLDKELVAAAPQAGVTLFRRETETDGHA